MKNVKYVAYTLCGIIVALNFGWRNITEKIVSIIYCQNIEQIDPVCIYVHQIKMHIFQLKCI